MVALVAILYFFAFAGIGLRCQAGTCVLRRMAWSWLAAGGLWFAWQAAGDDTPCSLGWQAACAAAVLAVDRIAWCSPGLHLHGRTQLLALIWLDGNTCRAGAGSHGGLARSRESARQQVPCD